MSHVTKLPTCRVSRGHQKLHLLSWLLHLLPSKRRLAQTPQQLHPTSLYRNLRTLHKAFSNVAADVPDGDSSTATALSPDTGAQTPGGGNDNSAILGGITLLAAIVIMIVAFVVKVKRRRTYEVAEKSKVHIML